MKKIKLLIFILVTIILVGHLGSTALYLAPNNPLKKYYESSVKAYMDPIFTQNWMLFAPEPARYSLKFWYRCKNETTGTSWSDWKDPMAPLIREHQDFRFTFKGKLLYVYQAIARSTLNHYVMTSRKLECQSEKDCHDQIQAKIKKGIYYPVAERFTRDLCLAENPTNNLAQFQILKIFPKSYSHRNDPGAFGSVENVEFSPIHIKSL